MLTSLQQEFSLAQALTTTGDPSDNIIDLGATGTVLNAPAPLVQDIGKGKPIPIYVKLDVDAGGTNPTIQVVVEVDTVEGFGSPTTLLSTEVIADGLAGDELYFEAYLPEGTNQRYLRLDYILTGTTPTYTVTAGITMARQTSVVPGA